MYAVVGWASLGVGVFFLLRTAWIDRRLQRFRKPGVPAAAYVGRLGRWRPELYTLEGQPQIADTRQCFSLFLVASLLGALILEFAPRGALPSPDSASEPPWQVVPLSVAPDRFRPGAWTDETVLWGLVRGRITKLNTKTGAVSTLSQTAWSFFPARGVVSWRNEGGTWMLREGGKPVRLARAGVDSLSGFDGPPTALWSPDGSRALLAWQGEGDSRYRLLESDGTIREVRVAAPGYYGNDAVLWLDSARVLFQVVAKSSLSGDQSYRESGWRGALAALDFRTGAYGIVANTRDSTFLRVAGRYRNDVLVTEWGSEGVRGHWYYDPENWLRRPAPLPKGRAFASPTGVVVMLLGAVADSADAIMVTASDTVKLGRVAQDAEPAFSPNGRRGALRTGRGVIVFDHR